VDQGLLMDQDGRVVCQTSGMPGDAQNDRIWVLMSSGDWAAYWHANCLRMSLKSSARYTLTLRIGDMDPRTPDTNLVPALEGGQPDWI
jgi:hypothetical protein